MKCCTVCSKSKPIEAFYLSHGRRCSPCKACVTVKAMEWAKGNPDAVKASHAKHRLFADRTDEIKISIEKQKAKRKLSSEVVRARDREYYSANAERIKELKNAARLANRDRFLATQKRYRATPQGKASASTRNGERRALHLQAIPAWIDKTCVAQFYECAEVLSRSGVKFSVDHIVPLKSSLVCGLHVEANLQILPLLKNISKSNRYWPDMPGEMP